jgi:hypothetical protein
MRRRLLGLCLDGRTLCGGRIKVRRGGSARGRQFVRQGMGSQAKLHQGLRVRQSGHAEAIGRLVAPHRIPRLIVPAACGLAAIITALAQRPLDLYRSPGGHAHLLPRRLMANGRFAAAMPGARRTERRASGMRRCSDSGARMSHRPRLSPVVRGGCPELRGQKVGSRRQDCY